MNRPASAMESSSVGGVAVHGRRYASGGRGSRCADARRAAGVEPPRARPAPDGGARRPRAARVAAEQHVFELRDVSGTLVGFRFPDYASGLEVAGYHLHFITDNRRRGGHVLDYRPRAGRLRIDTSSELHVELPPGVGAGRRPRGRGGAAADRAGRLAAQRPRDHHLLHLVGALADREDLGVAVEAADRVLLDVAVAAVDLDGLLGGAHGEPAGLELGLGGGEAEGLAGVLLEGGLVGEQARGLDLGRHVGELGLDRLVLGDRLAEGDPLLGVAQSLVQSPLGEAEAHGGDTDATAVERLQELAEALAPSSQQPLLLHTTIAERQRPGVGRVPAHLAIGLADLVTRRPVRHHDVRDLVIPGAGSDRDQTRDVSPGIGDELLGPVDDPLAILELRPSPRVPGVAPRLGLSQPKRCQLLAARQSRQPLLLLLLGAERDDRPGPQRRVRRHRYPDAGIHACELLDRERVGQVAGTPATVFMRMGNAHQPEFPELLHDFVREALGAVELLGDRLYLALSEIPHQALDLALLVAQIEVHSGRGSYSGRLRSIGEAVLPDRRIDFNELRRRVRRHGLLRALAEGPSRPPAPVPPPTPASSPEPEFEWRVEGESAPLVEPDAQDTVEFEVDRQITERLRGCRLSCAAVITALADLPALEVNGKVIEVALIRMTVRRPEGDAESCVRQHIPPEIRGVVGPAAGVMVLAHDNDRSVAAVDWTATGEWIGAKLMFPTAHEQYDWPPREEWPEPGT